MEVESGSPKAEQPVKQSVDEVEADEQPKVPNGVHAADEPQPEIDEPVAEHQPESSETAAEEVPEQPSEPAVESTEPEEVQQDDAAAAEVEAEPAKPVEEPSQSEPEPEPAPAAAVPREELPIWRKRIWFVRMPKPLEEPTSSASEHELESFKTQVAILNESLNVKRLERDTANEQTQAAQEAYNLVRQQYEARKEEAEPHRAKRRELREAVNSLQAEFKSEYGDLPAKSEGELDATVAALHHRITHESVPLSEEKAALAQIKKLEAAREQVREYGAKAAAVREARAAAAAGAGGTEELEAEVQALFDEMQTQRQILDKYRGEETAVRAGLRRIQDERSRIKGLQDEAYAKMVGARNEARDKSRVWGDNRRFSQQIRQVLARGEGALAEARSMCNSQMDAAHSMLVADDAFRAEYFKLWEGQRKGPTSPYQDAEEGGAGGGRSKGGARGGRSGTESPAVDEGSKARAEAVVAAALAQANETLAREKVRADEAAAAAAKAAAEKPSLADAETRSSGGESAAANAASAAAAALGNAPAAEKKPGRAKKSSASKAPPVVVMPELADDPFELPSAAKKAKEPSARDAEADKERVREQNRAAAAEAAARKERQRKTAEEKRRASELRRKELAAKEAAAKQQQSQQHAQQQQHLHQQQQALQAQQQQHSPAAGSPAVSEADVADAPASGAEAGGPAAVPAASGYDSSGAGGKSKQAKGRAVLTPQQPRARAPNKKRGVAARLLTRSYARLEAAATAVADRGAPLVREYPVAAAGAAFLALLVLLVALLRPF